MDITRDSLAAVLRTNFDGYLARELDAIIALANRDVQFSDLQLPERIRNLRFIESPKVHAEVTDSETNWQDCEICLYRGLQTFMFALSSLIASRTEFIVEGRVLNTVSAGAVPVRSSFLGLCDAYNNGFDHEKAILGFALDDTQWQFSIAVTKQALRFVVAHEIAHVLIHASASSPPELAMAREQVAELLSGNDCETAIAAWTEELAADLIACRFVESMDAAANLCDAFAGCRFALLAFFSVECNGENKTDPLHPPSEVRLRIVDRVMGKDVLGFDVGEMLEASIAWLSDSDEDFSKTNPTWRCVAPRSCLQTYPPAPTIYAASFFCLNCGRTVSWRDGCCEYCGQTGVVGMAEADGSTGFFKFR